MQVLRKGHLLKKGEKNKGKEMDASSDDRSYIT